MTIYRACTVRIAGRLVLPTLVAFAIAYLSARGDPALASAPDEAAGAAFMWLHVPALLLVVFALIAVLDEWPLFGRDRRDASWIAGYAGGRLHGCAAASAGGLTALTAALALTGVGFAWALDAERDPPPPRAWSVLATGPVLAADQQALRLDTSALGELDRVALRPIPLRRAGDPLAPAVLEIRADGEPLHERPLEFWSSRDAHVVRFESRRIEALEIGRVPSAGVLALALPGGAVEVACSGEHSSALNAMLAAASYALPAALALALACVLRRAVSTAVAVVVVIGVSIALTALGATPNAAAIEACARGRWIPAEPLAAHAAAALGAGALVLALARVTAAGMRRRAR